jgi:thiol-disulfide isomerase/thioredoxin
LILNFWATWCAPCKEELPLLDTYFRIDEKAGLRVLAVPTNFIIDRNGVLRYAKAGALTLDDLNTLLVPLLREPEPQKND